MIVTKRRRCRRRRSVYDAITVATDRRAWTQSTTDGEVRLYRAHHAGNTIRYIELVCLNVEVASCLSDDSIFCSPDGDTHAAIIIFQ